MSAAATELIQTQVLEQPDEKEIERFNQIAQKLENGANDPRAIRGPIIDKSHPVTLPKVGDAECRYVDFINLFVDIARTQHLMLKSVKWIEQPLPDEIGQAYEKFYSESLFGKQKRKTLTEYDETFDMAIHHIISLKQQMLERLLESNPEIQQRGVEGPSGSQEETH